MPTHSRPDLVTSLQYGVARLALAAICVLILFLSQPVRADEFKVLDAYTRYASSPAVNNPGDYIGWLKQQPQFQGGKLDNLPTRAIVLHYVDVRKMLNGLGYGDAEIEEISTGHTDSNVLFIVRPKSGRGFIVNRGMPGAGGISTQIAELGALGVTHAIHIGTAGLLGSQLPYASLIVSSGSYKDGAAFLLSSSSEEAAEQIAYPDAGLSGAIEQQLTRAGVTHVRGLGFTSPVYYFQKVGLLKALLGFRFDPDKAPGFAEMEQASFFITSRLSNVKSASIVAGSDRAVPTGDTVKQEFFDGDMDSFLALALRHAILTLSEQP
jgi:purine-nucleoside phosphorylase